MATIEFAQLGRYDDRIEKLVGMRSADEEHTFALPRVERWRGHTVQSACLDPAEKYMQDQPPQGCDYIKRLCSWEKDPPQKKREIESNTSEIRNVALRYK